MYGYFSLHDSRRHPLGAIVLLLRVAGRFEWIVGVSGHEAAHATPPTCSGRIEGGGGTVRGWRMASNVSIDQKVFLRQSGNTYDSGSIMANYSKEQDAKLLA
jgi:hypothetical protein